ncbi:MAG: bifunctional folylpolyglutamate synthase/dihydrofolate synthase [Candidatus Izemoplasmataceae bacterium]
MFSTLKEAVAWIESVHRFGDKYDLIRMEKATQKLNHPEKGFKSVHIAGTNGKGSTLTYLKQMFIEANYKVGTYTSPYIVRFNERIAINNNDISDEDLLKYINKIYDFSLEYLEEENDQISFFELVTLISFMYFNDQKVDIAIIEVGLGGLLDATNVITPIVSVITNIGFDHMNVLGNTLESIAKNKLGIVKPHVPLVTSVEQESLYPLFEATAKNNHSDYYHTKDYLLEDVRFDTPTTFRFDHEQYTLNMIGHHQVTNASLAILTAKVINQQTSYNLDDVSIKKGIENAFWPGRFERFGNIIIDGAHNEQGLIACLKTLRAYYPNHYVKSLFTVMADKDYTKMLRLLEENVDEIFFTEINYPRCEKALTLYEKSVHPNKHLAIDYQQIIEKEAPKGDSEILLITGSLYFISEVRKHL